MPRRRHVWLAALAAPVAISVTLAVGCSGESRSVDASSLAPAESASAKTSVVTPASKPVDSYWSNRFDAISSTAAAVTGDLQFVDVEGDVQRRLVFGLAGRYDTTLQGRALGLDAYSTAESATWGELLNAPLDGVVDVRRVVDEQLAAGAPNGGLCGSRPTTWVAIVRRPESEGSDSLMIAAFSSLQPPGPQSDDALPCGTYSYAPR